MSDTTLVILLFIACVAVSSFLTYLVCKSADEMSKAPKHRSVYCHLMDLLNE